MFTLGEVMAGVVVSSLVVFTAINTVQAGIEMNLKATAAYEKAYNDPNIHKRWDKDTQQGTITHITPTTLTFNRETGGGICQTSLWGLDENNKLTNTLNNYYGDCETGEHLGTTIYVSTQRQETITITAHNSTGRQIHAEGGEGSFLNPEPNPFPDDERYTQLWDTADIRAVNLQTTQYDFHHTN